MLGFFGIFGRARELVRLDESLRAAGLHPRLLPDAVKLTTLKLLKDAHGGQPAPEDVDQAAALIAYCALGEDDFIAATDVPQAMALAARLDDAIAAGDSLDARLVMLCLQARVIHPDLVSHHDLEMG